MKINHFKNPVEYNRNLEGLNCQKEALVEESMRRGAPELLSFLPDVDVEKMTLNNTELCSHILYANLRRLLRFPSLGMIDQKQKYCSIYTSNRNLKLFFNGQSVKAINYRTVAEIMLLYGLSGQDIQTMARWCCEFEQEDDRAEPDYGLLKGIYTKKQVAQIIRSCLDGKTSYFLPGKITKGQEYLSFADFLHTFRAIEMDPYEVLEMFVRKDTGALNGLNAAITIYGTFKTDPLDMTADVLPSPVLHAPVPLVVPPAPVPASPATIPLATTPAQAPLTAPAPESTPVASGPVQAPASSIPVDQTSTQNLSTQQEDPVMELESRQGALQKDLPAGRKSQHQGTASSIPNQPQGPVKTGVVHSNNQTFGTIMCDALSPLRRNKDVFVPKNIYVLRDGVAGHRGGQDRDFDTLFTHSGTTNLDVFNYLVRTSYIYAVPIYDLLFTDIKYGQYRPQKLFKTKEYSLTGIASELCRSPIKDEDLFRILSTYPPQRLNIFGYKTPEAQRPPQPMGKASVATPVSSPEAATNKDLPAKPAPAPSASPTQTQTTTEVNGMNIDLKMRLCQPCEADSWENDNPDRSAPGFHWETASAEICETAKKAVRELAESSCFDPMVIRAGIAGVVNLPFKAQVVITASGYRAAYDLY